MKLDIGGGKYVLAVSGGVDSVALLDLVYKESSKKPALKLIVAHYDHQIRADSYKDRQLVESLANQYGTPFYYEEGKLGPNASEELAREARYEFLWKIVKQNKADGLITAHHEDDLIESALINIIRGTGRRGLSSIINPQIKRPLLNYSKKQIIAYAVKNKLKWREDVTNQDPKYLRNYIRQNILTNLAPADRAKIVDIIKRQSSLNAAIDSDLAKLLGKSHGVNQLPRLWFNSLDHKVSSEVLAFWLKQNGLSNYDKKTIDRLVASLKSSKTAKKIDVFSNYKIEVTKDYLALNASER